MTFEEAQTIVSAITYKPRSKIKLDHSPFAWGVEIRVATPVLNVLNPGEESPLHGVFYLSYAELDCISEIGLLCFIREGLEKLEVHEVQEWFTFRGARIFDPHVPEQPIHSLSSPKPKEQSNEENKGQEGNEKGESNDGEKSAA